MSSILEADGYALTLGYNSLGRLALVTDSYGRAIQFTYTTGGALETATDPAGGQFRYSYSNKRLTSVSYPDETPAVLTIRSGAITTKTQDFPPPSPV